MERRLRAMVGALVGAALSAVPAWLVWPWWRRFVDLASSDLPPALAPTVRLSGYAGLWQLVVIAAVLGAVAAARLGDRS